MRSEKCEKTSSGSRRRPEAAVEEAVPDLPLANSLRPEDRLQVHAAIVLLRHAERCRKQSYSSHFYRFFSFFSGSAGSMLDDMSSLSSDFG